MNIRTGSLVVVKDRQTIEIASKEAGKLVNGKTFEVMKITKYKEQNDAVTYSLCELNTDNFYLLIKEVGKSWYGVGCFVPDDVIKALNGEIGGNRIDMLNAGLNYIFKEPPNPKSFVPKDLEHAEVMYAGDVEFRRVNPTAYGEVLNKQQMFALTHLRANKPQDNPECFVLEQGDLEDEGGGYMMLLQGVVLEDNELEIL